MIHYLKPVRSRYRSASLSLRSRRTTAADLLGWVSCVALAAVMRLLRRRAFSNF